MCLVSNNGPLLLLQVPHYSDWPGNEEVVNLYFSKCPRGNARAAITVLHVAWVEDTHTDRD